MTLKSKPLLRAVEATAMDDQPKRPRRAEDSVINHWPYIDLDVLRALKEALVKFSVPVN